METPEGPDAPPVLGLLTRDRNYTVTPTDVWICKPSGVWGQLSIYLLEQLSAGYASGAPPTSLSWAPVSGFHRETPFLSSNRKTTFLPPKI